MRALPVQQAYAHTAGVSFKAGKTTIYSDFDGTFHYGEPEYIQNLKKIKEAGADKVEFNITTGRNTYEFSRKIQEFTTFNPIKNVITSEGADIFEIHDSSLVVSKVTEQKREEIKELTRWEGQSLRAKLKEIFNKHSLAIVEPKAWNGFSKKTESLGSELKELGYCKEASDITTIDPKACFASIKQDGDLGFHIAFSKNLAETGEMETILKEIRESFHGIDYHEENSTKNFPSDYLPHLVLRPRPDGMPLTKVYDTSKAVTKAAKENDFVIIAGDGNNDRDMLNIANYLNIKNDPDFPAKISERTSVESYHKYLDSLEAHLKQNPSYVEELEKLPVMGVYVTKEDTAKNDPILDRLSRMFGGEEGSITKTRKIIRTDKQHATLDMGKGIKSYAESNAAFGKNLPQRLAETLGVKVQETVTEAIQTSVKNKNHKLSLFGAGLIAAGGAGLFFLNREKYRDSKKLKAAKVNTSQKMHSTSQSREGGGYRITASQTSYSRTSSTTA